MREPAIEHVQSRVSTRERAALAAYQTVSVTAKAEASAIRELLEFALTELGYLSEGCNGNITTLVRHNKKQQTTTKQNK